MPSLLAKGTPLEEKDLDARQDPQQVYHILDADGSQRLDLPIPSIPKFGEAM